MAKISGNCKFGYHDQCTGNKLKDSGPVQLEKCQCKCHVK